MITLILFFLCVSGVLLYLSVSLVGSNRSRLMVSIVAPILLTLSIGSYYGIGSLMGQPKVIVPDHFVLYTYTTINDFIYVWVRERGLDYPTTVRMPYTDEMKAKLELAIKMQQQGFMMEWDGNKQEFYQFDLASVRPKDQLTIHP